MEQHRKVDETLKKFAEWMVKICTDYPPYHIHPFYPIPITDKGDGGGEIGGGIGQTAGKVARGEEGRTQQDGYGISTM